GSEYRPVTMKTISRAYQVVVAADSPEVADDDGTKARLICGEFWGKGGPVEGVAADPRYLDVSVPAGQRKRLAVDRINHAFAYVFAGSGTFRDASAPQGVLTEQVDGGFPRSPSTGQTTHPSLCLVVHADES